MSKYSKKQLTHMSRLVITAKEKDYFRYFDFMMKMSIATGLKINDIKGRMLRLANQG